MRTRSSNRTKSYTVEKYDFESTSEEEGGGKGKEKAQKTRKNAEDDDNFASAAEQSPEEEVEDEEGEKDAQENDDNGSEASPVVKSRRRSAKVTKVTKVTAERKPLPAEYQEVELIPPEGQHKGYVGPYERGMRGKALVRGWYGPGLEKVEKAFDLIDRWSGFTVLPPKVPIGEQDPRDGWFWAPGLQKMELELAEKWHIKVKANLKLEDAWTKLSPEDAQTFRSSRGSMPVFLGPHDAQEEISFHPGLCYSISHTGLPWDQDETEDKFTAGWILDVGGIVLGLDWAPQRHNNTRQLLALAITPHADQEYYNYEEEVKKPDFQKFGVVQVWEFQGSQADNGYMVPRTKPGILRRSLCFEYGRVRKVKWNPTCPLLALLFNKGGVCIVDLSEADEDEEEAYYKLEEPVAFFMLEDEESIKATAMTWVNCNRIAVGYSDGSIGLWSIYPRCLLSRYPVHHNHIIDMVSGYPTMPSVISSIPIGGTARLLDLRTPSYETTEVQRPLVHTQPGLLSYSDHLLGFVSIYPSASSLNTVVGFMHHAHFPISRRLFTGDGHLSCLAVGRRHPYLLIGMGDGSLWSLNAQAEVFTNRGEVSDKIRLFQHEHRAAKLFPKDSPAAERGACRILQGFSIEKNKNAKPEAKTPAKKNPKLRKRKEDADNMEDEDDDDEDAADMTDVSRAVTHEPLTRVTAIEWNPNEDYGCWAAIALGSGLVRVLDLGLEQ